MCLKDISRVSSWSQRSHSCLVWKQTDTELLLSPSKHSQSPAAKEKCRTNAGCCFVIFSGLWEGSFCRQRLVLVPLSGACWLLRWHGFLQWVPCRVVAALLQESFSSPSVLHKWSFPAENQQPHTEENCVKKPCTPASTLARMSARKKPTGGLMEWRTAGGCKRGECFTMFQC